MAWTEKLPSGKYRARYRLPDGGKRTLDEHFTHKSFALKAASVAETEAAKLGWRDPEAAGKAWGEWCLEWWPTRSVSAGTESRDRTIRDAILMPKWATTRLVDINRHSVRAWAAEMIGEGAAPATVKRRVYLLSSSLTGAIDAEILESNPAAGLHLPSGQTDTRRYLSRDEATRLLLALREHEGVGHDLVLTMLNTGLRWGEAVGLQVGRVDLERGILRVAEVWDDEVNELRPYPKSRRIRQVPLVPMLEPVLARAIGGRTEGYVFLERGHVVHHSNWRTRVWLRAIEEAGIPGTRIHDLRHTYASWLLQAGIPLAEVGRMLGHVSPATTQIYAHLAEVPSAAILAALAPFSPQAAAEVSSNG